MLNGLIFILIGLQLRSVVEGLDDLHGGPDRLLCGSREPDRHPRAHYLGLPGYVRPRWAIRRINETPTTLAQRLGRSVDRDAGCYLAGSGPRAAAPDGRRDALPGPRPHHLPDVLRDPGDARRSRLSLPVLIRALGLEDDHIGDKEETHGRIQVAEAALERLDELADEDWVREDTTERIRGLYTYRRTRFASRFVGIRTVSKNARPHTSASWSSCSGHSA